MMNAFTHFQFKYYKYNTFMCVCVCDFHRSFPLNRKKQIESNGQQIQKLIHQTNRNRKAFIIIIIYLFFVGELHVFM